MAQTSSCIYLKTVSLLVQLAPVQTVQDPGGRVLSDGCYWMRRATAGGETLQHRTGEGYEKIGRQVCDSVALSVTQLSPPGDRLAHGS
jgi:hypothetical protein